MGVGSSFSRGGTLALTRARARGQFGRAELDAARVSLPGRQQSGGLTGDEEDGANGHRRALAFFCFLETEVGVSDSGEYPRHRDGGEGRGARAAEGTWGNREV